jgi:hypothetical protein
MKKLLLLIIVMLITGNIYVSGAEKEIESKISGVIVFMNGAQIMGDYKISLPGGKTTLKFTGMSSFLDKNSIQVTGQGNFTILSVKHTLNYLEKPGDENNAQSFGEKIKQLKTQIETKETEMKILQERKDFLVSNMSIVGSDKVIEPGNLKLYSDFFASGFSEVEMKLLSTQREIKELNEKLKALEQQYQEAVKQKDQPTSEIIVEVESKQETTGNFKISYLITNAGWYPTYDLRVEDIDSPVQLTYQANVYQQSGMDWNNVQLTISNANPAENANIPTLYPYYLSFNNVVARGAANYPYNPNIREVKGKVIDAETGEAVPFATIRVKDKMVGTTSDYDGNFSIAIPSGGQALQVTFVGYEPLEVPISLSYMTLTLKQSMMALQEVQIVEYKVSGVRSAAGKDIDQSTPLDISTITRQTNFEFKIESPYSIQSNSNPLKIDMKNFDLKSEYIYKTIPKLSEKAFLIALISDWEAYDLLDGEVNLYFENTFVGKSLLDLSQIADTLEVSLGPDKGISVKRELEKEYSSKQFLGNNKIENRSWKTTIKNNKPQKVKIMVYDQVPVSNNEDITVETINISEGSADVKTGEVTWELELEPGGTVSKTIEYSVKYPKGSLLKIQ